MHLEQPVGLLYRFGDGRIADAILACGAVAVDEQHVHCPVRYQAQHHALVHASHAGDLCEQRGIGNAFCRHARASEHGGAVVCDSGFGCGARELGIGRCHR